MGALAFCREKIADLVLRRGFGAATDIPVEDADFVVLDTELTGLEADRDSIISIGAVRMKGNRIDLGDAFYRMAAPSAEMKPQSIVVHGITPDEVEGKPPIDAPLYELIGFCRDSVIVGHFVTIDMDFINKETRRIYGTNLKNHVIDTHRIYEWLKENDRESSRRYGGYSDDLNLFTLAKKYRIPVSGGHNALNDAFITAQLFQRFLSFLPGLGVRTLRDLLRIGRP